MRDAWRTLNLSPQHRNLEQSQPPNPDAAVGMWDVQDKSISANRSYSTTDLTLLDNRQQNGSIPFARRRLAGETAGSFKANNNPRQLEGLLE